MSENDASQQGNTKDFWRASRFLGTHRTIMVVSILCAIAVGVIFTASLSTMLPIFRLLLNGDTIQGWANRQIVENRIRVGFADDPAVNTIIRRHDDASADLKVTDSIVAADGERSAAGVLRILSDPDRSQASVVVSSREGERAIDKLPLAPVTPRQAWMRRAAAAIPATTPVTAIGCILAALVVLTIVGNIFRFFQTYLADKAAVLTVNDIRRKLYDHALHVPLGFFTSKGTSDLTSRLVQDSLILQDGFRMLLGQVIQEPIKAGMAFGLAMYISWKLTLFLVLFAPVGAWVIRKYGKKMRRASRKALQNSAAMLGQIEGSLIGIRVVKAASAERYERRRYRGIMSELVRYQLKMSRIDAMNQPILESINIFIISGVVLYACYMVLMAHTLKASDFVLVMGCLVGMGESLRRISKLNNILQKCSAAATRIFEILDLPLERVRLSKQSDRPRHLVNLPPLASEVRFEAVTFTYPNAGGPAVDGVNLIVPRGQSVAIVGRNGSGKTTLLALLPRFYDPQAGRILLDGVDVRSATLPSLRRQIAIVTQDSVIFPGSIAENIAYAMPLATRDQIRAAAQRAFAHDFIMEKPAGYDTLVGEHGAQLSGGQKQRICIARAILRDSPILILDEATSQVDAESEHLIQQAIESLMHERTTFVIAHRFSTILSADVIVVMERGRIVGQGKHEELLATCPTYQQLYERQMVAAPVG